MAFKSLPFLTSTKSPAIVEYQQVDQSDGEDSRSQSPLSDGQPTPTHLSTLQLCALTCSIGGLQVVWATIFSNGTQYLKALGFPESATALVWVAPPLCGCLLQPLFGSFSDACQHPWGRRRPYILLGAIGITISILTVAFASTIALILAKPFDGTQVSSDTQRSLAIILAVIGVWTLSISIQPFQCSIRALVIDACPRDQQSSANIWAARFTALGSIAGTATGSCYYSSEVLRFRFLAVLAVLAVGLTSFITCTTIKEQPRSSTNSTTTSGLLQTMRGLRSAYLRSPPSIRAVCRTQTVAWMGWFGFLFYRSSYASDKYLASLAASSPDSELLLLTNSKVMSTSARLGTTAALSIAVVSLISSALLPLISARRPTLREKDSGFSFTLHRGTLSPETVWSGSLVVTSIILLASFFVTNVTGAIALIASVGPSWSVTTWAPYALLGEALRQQAEDDVSETEKGDGEHQELDVSGSVIGLHNIAMSAPQILAAGLCYLILWTADHFGSVDGIGWVFRVSAVAFMLAAFMAYKIGREL